MSYIKELCKMRRAFCITAAPTVAVMLVRCGAHRITAPMRNVRPPPAGGVVHFALGAAVRRN